ncbi:RNA polymerase sigma factor SigX [bacterium BMS3Abin02]|nr:RNA polymerase sigma factor SigX [bacterium BMS3Abin02]GBE21530.1 RNA polymerase sigma factor SigX [bacterium BMS3Bbin01]
MVIGPSFDSVLASAQTGAEWAWEVLYHDLAGQVLGYLRSRGASDPEDRLGDVFLQLARNIGTFKGDEAAFRSWVFMVAHHRLIDERRKRSRHREHLIGEDQELDAISDPRQSAEAEAMTDLATRDIRQSLKGLSHDQRDVLTLRIIGGLTVTEIAHILRKRPGAVKALQRRGLNALRKELAKDVPL